MTIVRISKKRVIHAIKTEPALAHGVWIDSENLSFDDRENALLGQLKPKDCSVCAVGAVMRNILSPESTVKELGTAADISTGGATRRYKFDLESFKEQVQYGHHMRALSDAFEGLSYEAANRGMDSLSTGNLSRHQTYRVKKKVCALVQKYFPSSIEVDINGALPAKDVEVVSYRS